MSNQEVYDAIKSTITTPIVNECLNLQEFNTNYKILIGGFFK
jgi:hypothetical protein